MNRCRTQLIQQSHRETGTVQLLSVREVAAILNCSQSFILARARRGELTGYRMGRLWRFSREAVDNYIGLCEVQPSPKSGTAKRVVKNTAVGLPILTRLAAERGIKF